jgi:hypothetical protein
LSEFQFHSIAFAPIIFLDFAFFLCDADC